MPGYVTPAIKLLAEEVYLILLARKAHIKRALAYQEVCDRIPPTSPFYQSIWTE